MKSGGPPRVSETTFCGVVEVARGHDVVMRKELQQPSILPFSKAAASSLSVGLSANSGGRCSGVSVPFVQRP